MKALVVHDSRAMRLRMDGLSFGLEVWRGRGDDEMGIR
jgi:hypothetical protein